MTTLVLVIHVISCLILILVILLQSSKGADLAGAFGMMGSQTAFGPRGTATILSKATTTAAVVFMVTSLALSYMMSGGSTGSSLMERKAVPKAKTQSTRPAEAPKKAPAAAKTPAPAPAPAAEPGAKTVQYTGPDGRTGTLKVEQVPAGKQPAPAKTPEKK